MKKILALFFVTTLLNGLYAQNVGIGETAPASKLSVKGNLSVGSSYSETPAPADGAIIKGQVGIGTSSPNASAVLDITSTSQGVLYPRMSLAQRNAIANPPQGLTVYDTSSKCLEFYVGSAWQTIACGCTTASSAPATITGTTFSNLCATPTTYVFSVPNVVYATSYTWSVIGDAGATITGQGTSTVSIAFSTNSGATSISVVAVNSCGSSPATTASVSIQSPPVNYGYSITGLPAVACPSAIGNVALTAPYFYPTPTSYTWSVPSALGVIGSTSASTITVVEPNTPGVQYTISVTGNNCAGSSLATASTVSIVGTPSAPTGLSASSIGTSFTASWNAASTFGTIAGYLLDVSTTINFSSFVPGYHSLSTGNVTSYNVTGLTCGVTYYFRLRAFDNCTPIDTSGYSYVDSTNNHGKQLFLYTGANQTFTVPCNVTSLTVKMWGGGGGGGDYGSGGAGGYVSGTYATTGGSSLTIVVGGGGATNNYVGATGTAGATTFGGGGYGINEDNYGESSGSGGGYSALLNGATTVAVAGGGGGGGSYSNYLQNTGTSAVQIPGGGPGGGTTGGAGFYGGTTTTANGKGGTAAAGGAAGGAGTGATAATAGASLTGGHGGGANNTYSAGYYLYGGGGGGGYYGGGGGGGSKTTLTNCGGGGGGSSYTGGLTGATNTQATTQDQGGGYAGGVYTGAMGNNPPNNTDTDYVNSGGDLGQGGSYLPNPGTAGLVVISW